MRKSVDVFCRTIKYLRDRIWIRVTFFIVLLFIYLVKRYVMSGASEKVSDIALLLLKSSIFVFGIIILFSITTILVSYLLYRKSKAKPEINFTYTGTNEVMCEIVCEKLLFPFAGTVKAELTFDKQYDTLIILKKSNSRRAYGRKKLTLPDIRNYDFNKVTLFFQDFFRLFSFRITYPQKSSVAILPVSDNSIELSKVSYAADTNEVRTETLRHKEGELLHFKHFEVSDDIRRIVWPVYAKTKELVIRTVEMHNMYASRVDVYASFSNNYLNMLEKTISDSFLNKYKTDIWEVYKSLTKDSEVHFIPDQKSKVAVEYRNEVSAQISGMDWHTNKVGEYLGDSGISVICISSLIPVQDVEKILDKLNTNMFVVFTSLKSSVGKLRAKDILQAIFTIPEEKKINWKWLFSTGRKRILDNDKAIRNTLISRNLNYIEL